MTSHQTRPVVLIAEELSPATVEALGPDFEIRTCDGSDRGELLAAIVDVDAILVRSATKVDAEALAGMLADAKASSEGFADEGNVTVSWDRLWQIEPILFDDALIDLCDEAVRETCGTSHRLPSGPLHDAAEVSRAGIPTVMLFVQSLHGISHNKIEDTEEGHLELAVEALAKLAEKTIARLSS